MDSQLRQVPAASGLSNAHFYERVPLPRCGICKNNNRCDLRAPTTRSRHESALHRCRTRGVFGSYQARGAPAGDSRGLAYRS